MNNNQIIPIANAKAIQQIQNDIKYENMIYKEFKGEKIKNIYNLLCRHKFYKPYYWHYDRSKLEIWLISKSINNSGVLLSARQKMGHDDYNNKHPISILPCIADTIYIFLFGDPKYV